MFGDNISNIDIGIQLPKKPFAIIALFATSSDADYVFSVHQKSLSCHPVFTGVTSFLRNQELPKVHFKVAPYPDPDPDGRLSGFIGIGIITNPDVHRGC
ncbi:MAG: hypothetical protein A2Z25_08685 [Planctomycetes bacterium RBG_16_55_9]|nr:MAG: hypothetical protein A2Z25_08685 [Planctomycetes bacterium RBG_16_55_9]